MKNGPINIQIEIAGVPSAIRKNLRTITVKTLEKVSRGKGVSLTILVCDDGHIRELNNTYRGIDKPTDVLSFPDGTILPGTDILYLGDIAISYPSALLQSKTAGHPVEQEIALLVVHGVLHLLGYDHSTGDEKKIMSDLQQKVLFSLGYTEIMSTIDL